VLGEGQNTADALRQISAGIDGIPAETISRWRADRVIRTARLRAQDTADIPDAAARVLKLASRELAALESSEGPRDLDRLHKLAQILGTIQRLQPSSGKQERTLLDLSSTDQTEPQS
jgi:hypothetical protein